MSVTDSEIFLWLAQFAYQPTLIYLAIVGFMLASAVGLPLPEEITLLSVGVLCYIGANPALYPPPFEGAQPVNRITAAIIAFTAVVAADFIIFTLGRYGGGRIKKTAWYGRQTDANGFKKVERWVSKYGIWSVAFFRFTPGIRFPGHMACGMLGLSPWKFLAVDTPVALISVPTQVLLVAIYGEHIIGKIQQFKFVLIAILLIAFLIYLAIKLSRYIKKRYKLF